MLDYLADKSCRDALRDAARLIDLAVENGFARGRLRPMEFGGDQGTRAVTSELLQLVGDTRVVRQTANGGF